MLIEVQALVTPSAFSTASRRSTGIDPKRLTLLLAVLEKQMDYRLHALDVFVSLVGGVKVVEPAMDLGIILSLASSYCDQPVEPHTISFGEVGLGGELRTVPRLESRLKEAINMGFKRCILPVKSAKSIQSGIKKHIDLYGAASAKEAIKYALPNR
jgi:DNA repair protein RadA/Sms